ncbi:MAG: aminopeptidase P family protein [Bacteroidaceae bacterium]|nr:aminopeptidase P family protein [Bacteroidaceae bacterium]
MTKAEVITRRVEALRQWMRQHNLDAYIFPSTDPHASEYVPDHWKVREWISGFNGSAGTAVVMLDNAALWTDSRYWLAAEEQLEGTPFEVVRCTRNVATAEELMTWICAHPDHPDGRFMDLFVGFDPWVVTSAFARELIDTIWHNFCEERIDCEPVATLWTERPPLPTAPLELHPLALAGRTAAQKMDDIRDAAFQNDANGVLVTQLDEIAWTLNLRGADVHCTPVFVSYLIVLDNRPDSSFPDDEAIPAAILYVDEAKLTDAVRRYLAENQIAVRPYQTIHDDLLSGRAGDTNLESCALQVDPEVTCHALKEAAEHGRCFSVVTAPSPVPALRAIKNDAEIAGFRNAMRKDGVAMVRFLKEMDCGQWKMDGGQWTEMGVDNRLTALRAEQEGFRDISFDTIAGYAAHGAIVHYEATPETDIPLEPHGLLLLDSGAQYEDGTTDITRTIPLGPLTDEERRDYTLVLKGHIRLSSAVFPDGTSGTQLDVLARYAMWQDHKNYGHGTGHGVGSYLSVHEGPHQFRMNYVAAPLHAGMTVTIEPGIYIAGSHGVRIENTMLITTSPNGECAERVTRSENEPTWLRLEPLTLCPIDTRPIIREMMLPDEIDYLNRYHARVREELLPLLSDASDRDWLIQATQPLTS